MFIIILDCSAPYFLLLKKSSKRNIFMTTGIIRSAYYRGVFFYGTSSDSFETLTRATITKRQSKINSLDICLEFQFCLL
jgi:hypothetical protein